MVPLGTPPYLIPFMVLIELTRNLIRPLTLSVRLAANMLAGHLLLRLIAGGFSLGRTFLLVGRTLGLIIVLECAVAIIQSYVFRALIVTYVSERRVSAI